MESILTSVKKLLGIGEDYTRFDPDIIMHINGAFFILNQLGVGPEQPFVISDNSASWDDFESEQSIELVKPYIYLRVRKIFDPPQNSSHLNAIDDQIREYEWRLNVQVDTPEQ